MEAPNNHQEQHAIFFQRFYGIFLSLKSSTSLEFDKGDTLHFERSGSKLEEKGNHLSLWNRRRGTMTCQEL